MERLAGGAPVLPDRAPRASGPSVCRAMNRLAAGLGACGDHAGPPRALLTSEPPAVRVRGDGGGGPRGPATRGRWGRRVRPCGAERCLAQRRELQCRSQGTAHQLAQGARAVSACRQAGEHVFGKGRGGVGRNGTAAPRERPHLALARDPGDPGLQEKLHEAESRSDAARAARGRPRRPSGQGRAGRRRGGDAANIGIAAAYREGDAWLEHWRSWGSTLRDRARRRDDAERPAVALPPRRKTRHEHEHDQAHEVGQRVDQISTFVRTFSITASVNSTVPALPPRSIVLTPPAVVSSVAS